MTTSLFDTRGTANSGSGSLDNLSVYAGNVFRQAQAARIKLAAGEERSGEEIVVPISKLHTVSGSVVNRSGGVVNSGMVVLFDGQEKMPVARSAMNSNDGTFRFSFVPSGTYRLEAYGADVVPTEIRQHRREQLALPSGRSWRGCTVLTCSRSSCKTR